MFHRTAHNKGGVQRHHLKPPLESVGHAKIGVERRAPGRSHDLAVNLVDEIAISAPGAPVREDHVAALLFVRALG